MTDLASLVVRMQADNSQYVKALDQATARLSKFQAEQAQIFGDIANSIASAFTVGALVEFSSHAIESAASLDSLSQAAGVSTEALSGLRLAAAANGLSQDELGQSLKKLNVNLSDAAGNATGKAGVAFRALGISVTDANGKMRDAGSVLGDIADKFQGFADGPNKTALAIQLLGRQGQALIPVLNQGSAGLDDFRAKAEAAGIVVSGSLAAAAEQFEEKFRVIKATVSEGFGNQLAAQLLPVLTTLAEQLTSSTSAGAAFAEVAGFIVTGVKFIAAGVLEVVAEFTKLGNSIGALGAVAVAAAHGDFSQAAAIWKASNEDNVAVTQSTQNKIRDIFAAGTDQQLSIIQTSAKKIGAAAPNMAALEQSDAAIKKLQEFNDQIKAESSAFGLGGAALTNYKLQFGPLADAIKKAGAEGDKLAASIRANAATLQTKEDTKEVTDYTSKLQEQVTRYGESSIAAIDYATTTGKLGQALKDLGPAGDAARAHIHDLAVEQVQLKNSDAYQGIDNQLLTLTGHLAQAADAAFKFNNRLLIKDTAAAGSDQQKQQLADLEAKTVAQGKYNEQVQAAAVVQQTLATVEAQTQLQQSAGQITDIQAQAQIETARAAAITQLQQIHDTEKSIADDSKIPQLTQQTIAFGNSITALQAQTNQLANTMRNNLETDASDAFLAVETGAKSAKAAVADFFKDLEKQILEMVNKNIAQSIFGTGGAGGSIPGALAGLFGGGGASGASGGSGIGSFFSSLFGGSKAAATPGVAQSSDFTGLDPEMFGGGFASGGTLGSGKWGVVGEKGPELAYSGSKDMHVIPNGAGGKPMSVVNNFTMQSQTGTISRRSQTQQAGTIARTLAMASARNNR